MAICPFAIQDPITHGGQVIAGGTYAGGPFKIVHHTTEGGSFAGARATYEQTGNIPHFTVDSQNIHQHLDTSRSATALRNKSGGVETNRSSAIQFEVVGFAAHSKPLATLQNVARLCRWIEQTHQVAREWPNGFPKPPGVPANQHNRDAHNWITRSGHYGHCHVPENSHVDPGYTQHEVEVIMDHVPSAVFVGQDMILDADAFLEGDTVWGAVRPVITAMGGTVQLSGDHAVTVSFRSVDVNAQARGIADGRAFIPMRELRRFNGVLVDFIPGDRGRINITLPEA